MLSIARIWGTSFGLPHPGLMPNKRELQEQREIVADAVAWLKRRDIAASGQVAGTRNAAKRILAEARRRRADAIVMAADPPQHWLVANMVWSQEPQRVRRLAPVPVYLVIETEHIGKSRCAHQCCQRPAISRRSQMIAFIGDVHREFDRLAGAVAGLPADVKVAIQVGDLGLHADDLGPTGSRSSAARPPGLLRHRKSRPRAVLPRDHAADRDGAQPGVRSAGHGAGARRAADRLPRGRRFRHRPGRTARWRGLVAGRAGYYGRCRPVRGGGPGGFPRVPHAADFRLPLLWLFSRPLGRWRWDRHGRS